MKKAEGSILFMAVIAAIFSGCSVTYPIDSPAEARYRLNGISGMVHCNDGAAFEAKAIHASSDSLAFIDAGTGALKRVALRDITMVNSTNYPFGAVDGGMIGSGSALVIFGTISIANNEKRHTGMELSQDWDRNLYRILISGAVGAFAGAIIGRSETYEFDMQKKQ